MEFSKEMFVNHGLWLNVLHELSFALLVLLLLLIQFILDPKKAGQISKYKSIQALLLFFYWDTTFYGPSIIKKYLSNIFANVAEDRKKLSGDQRKISHFKH